MLRQKSIVNILCGVFGFFLLVFLVLLSFASITSAQVVSRFQANDISLDIEPSSPEAFESVTIDLVTFSIDLDIHHITWLINGEQAVSGVGKKSLTTTVGAYGEATSVQVIIKSQDGRLVRKSLTLRPATVDVLWEAVDSYVPPFYKGKALPSRGAVLKFMAVPNLVIGENHLNASELDYTWSWNYKVKPDSSGYNKQFMGIKNIFINREEVVSVKVKNSQANVRGEGSAKLTFIEPEINFYKNFPNSTAYDFSQSLKQPRSSVGEEVALRAIPYFFSIRPNLTLDSLGYQWKVNGEIVSKNTPENKNLISLISSGQGTTDVSLSVIQPEEDFQLGQGSIKIISQ